MSDALDRQARHEAKLRQVEETLRSLPPHAAAMARKWRRAVELAGRAGPGGSAVDLVVEFVTDVAALVAPAVPVPTKAAGEFQAGSGV